jgi:hypothetical protein
MSAMTFLEICQRLRSEAGIAGTGPNTTANQIGELGRIVNWVQDAYVDIQEKHDQWGFLRQDFTLPLTIGVAFYPATSIPGLSIWLKSNPYDSLRCYLATTDDEQWLTYRSYEEFRGLRLRGANRSVSGRPQDFTISPNNDLMVWPIPDQAYSIDGEYVKSASKFTIDSDVPVFADFHMVIVWSALMKYASYAAEPSLYAQAQKEYGRLINKLELKYLPTISLGEAMA